MSLDEKIPLDSYRFLNPSLLNEKEMCIGRQKIYWFKGTFIECNIGKDKYQSCQEMNKLKHDETNITIVFS